MSPNIYNIILGILVGVLITIFLRRKWQFIGIEQESFHTEIELGKNLPSTHSKSMHVISCLEAFVFILYNVSVASSWCDKKLKRRKGSCRANLDRCSRSKLQTYCVHCYNRDLYSGNYTKRELMMHEDARLISFESCPDDLGFSALTLSKLGFYYAGKGIIKCFCCDISFTCMPLLKPISEIHKLRSPYCKFARGEDLSNVPSQHDDLKDGSPLNLFTGEPIANSNTCPRYNDYASLEMRLKSFEDWRLLSPKPSELSAAGFFFTNKTDIVRCFQCGINMKDWIEERDPLIEHAIHSPDCLHVRGREDNFVSLVKQADSEALQHEQSCVAGLSAAALACIKAGYRKEQVEEALNALRMTGVEPTFYVLVKYLRTNNNRADDHGAQNYRSDDILRYNLRALEEKATKLAQERNALSEENQQLKERALCKICLDNEANIVFSPCGHIVSCNDCAHFLRKCAICRTLIRDRIRTYLS